MLGHKQKNLTWSRYLEPNCSWLRDVQGICSLVISWHTKTRPNRPSKSVAAVPETLTITRDAGWCGRLLKHLHLTNETKCSKEPNGPISYFNWLGSNRFVSTSIIYRLCAFSENDEHNLVSGQGNITWWQWRTKPVAETNSFGSEISRQNPPLCDFSCTWLRHGGSETCPALGSKLGLLHGVWHSTRGIWPCLWVPKEVLKFGMTQRGTSSSWMLIFLRRLLVYKFVAHCILDFWKFYEQKCWRLTNVKSKGNTCACVSFCSLLWSRHSRDHTIDHVNSPGLEEFTSFYLCTETMPDLHSPWSHSKAFLFPGQSWKFAPWSGFQCITKQKDS